MRKIRRENKSACHTLVRNRLSCIRKAGLQTHLSSTKDGGVRKHTEPQATKTPLHDGDSRQQIITRGGLSS